MSNYVIRRLLFWIFLALCVLIFWKKCGADLFSKKETPAVAVTHNTVLTQIEQLGRLELVRYHFKDVVEYSQSTSRWLPDSKAVLIVAGEAVGCIDLRKMTEQDITFIGDSTVQIQLPAPELCYYKVDHSKSKIFSLSNTYFQDAELVDKGYKYAEKNIKKSALDAGILKQTAVNADKILKPMLEKMTGRKVVLIRKRTTSNPRIGPRG